MGEVFRARDTKLGREVALKVLPHSVAADLERLQRFEREAQLLATLNHPRIAAIYGVEDSTATKALVLELVEGPTLQDRIGQGALAVEEAISIGRQIAEALEAAHEKGVIHRDLKPANVKLTADGDVKVLDFGLAKALDPASSTGPLTSPALMNSPTVTSAGTQLGVILGTAAYMAPEQARGGAVDKRADIWAFGAVLWEMLTGRRLFAGDTVTDTLAGVLKTEIDWSALPASTPAEVRRLLERCLTRDRKQRLHDIGDARLELEHAALQRGEARAAAPGRAGRVHGAILVAGGLLVGAALGALAWSQLAPAIGAGPAASVRSSILPPDGYEFDSAAISPRGDLVAMVLAPRSGREGAGRLRLYLRRLDSFEALPVSESEGVEGYAFSADGRWLYFLGPAAAGATQLRLARIPVDGTGAPVTVRRWEDSWGSWMLLGDGEMLVTLENGTQFLRLPADGSPPSAAREFDRGGVSGGFYFTNRSLPDGRPLLRVNHYGSRGYQNSVAALDLESGKVRILVEDASRAHLLPSGELLFGRGESLLVAAFDVERSLLTEAPRSVLQGLRTEGAGDPYPRFTLSPTGTLLYPPGGRLGSGRRLVTVTPQGVVTPWSDDRMSFNGPPSVSADGTRLAQAAMEANGLLFEIWASDLGSPSLRRLVTFPGVDSDQPVLDGDGSRIAYRRYARAPEDGLYVRAVDGGGDRRVAAITASVDYFPSSWSPDGTRLLATRVAAGNGDVVVFAPDGDSAEPAPLLDSAFIEESAVFSPDGGAIAFGSNETGRREIYVATLRGDGRPGPAVLVSRGSGAAGSGSRARWRTDGRAVLYVDSQERVQTSEIARAPRLGAAPSRVLVDLRALDLTRDFDLLPDGRLLAVQRGSNEGPVTRFDLVQGFTGELERAARGR